MARAEAWTRCLWVLRVWAEVWDMGRGEGGAQVAGIGMHYMCGIISTISIFNRSRIVIFQKLSMRILKFL